MSSRERIEELEARLHRAQRSETAQAERAMRYGQALREIVDRFDDLNGNRCRDGQCMACLRCIAQKALRDAPL